jgi:hypothetical protein
LTFEFDFPQYVKNFRYRRWRIDRAGTRISKIFAMHFVLGMKSKSLFTLSRRLNRFRRLWLWRLQDMATREMWLPTKQRWLSPYDPNFDLKKFKSAYRRCMFCRPSCAHYQSPDGHQVELRPCWRVHICPFCTVNLVTAHYVYVKYVINRLSKHDSNFVGVCRVVRWYVPAPGFNPIRGTDHKQIQEHAQLLRRVLVKQKQNYRQLIDSKKLTRSTRGALWRLVVIPDAAGWHIEVRQFFICRPNTRLPVARIRGAKVTYLKSVKLDATRAEFTTDFFELFGEFCRYPMELLTGYAELTAAYLHAAHGLQLVSGTGLLVKTSRSLMRYMRERKHDALAKKTLAGSAGATPAV